MAFDPIEAQKYLKGVEYPISKQELIATAERNGAPQEMIDDLQGLGEEQVDGPSAVQSAFSGS
jgi:Protein of unknown function (DUF2795)